MPVTRPAASTDEIVVTRLPACRAATVIVRGPYRHVRDARTSLEHWVAAAGLRPVGPFRVIYLQFGAEPELRIPRGYLVERDADLVTEVQLPVA